MPFQRPLEVRPLQSYPIPGYPSADGLAAALRKRPEGPWPFLAPPALVSAILAASSTACGPSTAPSLVPTQPAPTALPPAAPPTSIATMAVEPDAAPSEPEQAVAAQPQEPPAPGPLPDIGLQLPHPFSWEASHLPFAWFPYGTGAPARLSEDQVRPVMERVLRAAGVRPAPKVAFARPGIAVELDGYDASKHVGWVFVEWQKLEDPFGSRGGMRKVDGKDGQNFANMISHAEMRALMELEKRGQEHIIVINQQDPRLSTPYDSKARHPNAPLQKLESNLRAYLGWLKSQGAL